MRLTSAAALEKLLPPGLQPIAAPAERVVAGRCHHARTNSYYFDSCLRTPEKALEAILTIKTRRQAGWVLDGRWYDDVVMAVLEHEFAVAEADVKRDHARRAPPDFSGTLLV